MATYPIQPEDHRWMQQALHLARRAEALGEVPVGAVVVQSGRAIGAGFNQLILDSDPTAHAEILALRAAGRHLGNYRLPGASLYVTLEPCSMCAGAIVSARIERVIFATSDPRTGAAGSVFQVLDNPQLNHRCQLTTGVCEHEAAEMLRAFFRARRRSG